MIEELVSRVFATRNATHLAHWATKSYAEHVTLGGFYDALIDRVDAITEAHQGAFGLIGEVEPTVVNKMNLAEHIKQEARWIEQNRDKVSGGVEAIGALVDDLTNEYLTTYYKLTNLS
jgi:DNA-binding ferritin-like protein